MQLHYLAFLLYHLFRLVRSIEVTPHSECYWICVDDIGNGDKANDESSATYSDDVVCEDYQLAGPNSTDKGRKWKDCLTCELTSKAVDPLSNENELYWIIFNLRFSFAWCVFAYQNNKNPTDAGKSCAETCRGPNNVGEAALVNKLMEFNISAQYRYCETENRAFPRVADDCIKCLKEVPNTKLMVNYVKALNVACTQKPALGETLKLDFEFFPASSTPSTTQSVVVIARTTDSGDLSTSAIITSAVVAATARAKANTDKNLRLGLGVGLTAGGVVVILTISGLIYSWRKIKRNLMTVSEQARARWEADNHGGQQEQQQQYYLPRNCSTIVELDALYNGNSLVPEADNHGLQQEQQQQDNLSNNGSRIVELDALYNGNTWVPEADDGRLNK